MLLRATTRKKDGKTHRYWSVVENRRLADGGVLQRHVLYLGKINDSQQRGWRRLIEVLDERDGRSSTLALFPEDQGDAPVDAAAVAQGCLSQSQVRRPRQWGVVWLAWMLWQQLRLDEFWGERLPRSHKGTRWDQVLFVLAAYRLIAPGSEWYLHREWYERTALSDVLGSHARIADIHMLYRCHDRLLVHKSALFGHLTQRWRDLFNVCFDVLLCDLTSTYFESNPPFGAHDKHRYGYSRDHRSDCVQVAIALIVTPRTCRWPTICCRATPPITRRCAAFCNASNTSTARPGGPG